MSGATTQPLSSLAGLEAERVSVRGRRSMGGGRAMHDGKYCGPHGYGGSGSSGGYGGYGGYGWAWGFLLFIVLVIIIWVIIWVTCPKFLRKDRGDCDDHHDSFDKDCKKCSDVDGGKALLCAIIIALIIILIIWVIAYAVGWGGGGYGSKHHSY